MRNFNLGSLDQWRQVAVGEILQLDMPAASFRSVAFEVMSSDTICCNAVSGDDYWLVANGVGYMAVKFAIDRPVGLVFIGDPAADIFVRTHVDAPVIPESQEASYTTIEPRPAGPSDDLRRMMHIVKINQQRREAELMAEVRRLTVRHTHEEKKAAAPKAAPPAPAAPEAVTDE